MSNWYRRAQETGTPGAEGAGGADQATGAVEPNPQARVEDVTTPTEWQEADFVSLDRQIKSDILKPLYEFYGALMNEPYPEYGGDDNPFMMAMIQIYEKGIPTDFKRHLDSYANVSRQVVSGTPNPALSNWIAQLLYMFPEGEAKTQLQNELRKLNMLVVMQVQTT